MRNDGEDRKNAIVFRQTVGERGKNDIDKASYMSQLSVMNQESGENRGTHPNIKKNRSHDQHNLMPFGLGELFWSSTIPKYTQMTVRNG